jgi:hypothetical protein
VFDNDVHIFRTLSSRTQRPDKLKLREKPSKVYCMTTFAIHLIDRILAFRLATYMSLLSFQLIANFNKNKNNTAEYAGNIQ